MKSLPVWMPGPMFLLGGVSVSDPKFLPGGSLSRGSLSGVGIYVQGGLCPGGSLFGRVLCPGVSVQGVSVRDTPRQRPMYGKERAIHILLEFFLFLIIF